MIILNKFLEPFLPMVDFLAEILGNNAEVVLHDLSDMECSVVKLRNGHISGRKIGDPVTNFVMKVVSQDTLDSNFKCNYVGLSKDNRQLKSSSFYIKNDEGKVVGMLCVNMEIEEYLKAREFLDKFFLTNDIPKEKSVSHSHETFGHTVSEMIDAAINNAIAHYDYEISRLTSAEKEAIVNALNIEGIFLLKGAISKVAVALDISEPTVYRYLSKHKS